MAVSLTYLAFENFDSFEEGWLAISLHVSLLEFASFSHD